MQHSQTSEHIEKSTELFPLEYTRHLYANVLEWYRNADSKAQLILTIDSIFLSFLSNFLFGMPDKLITKTSQLNFLTWLFLTTMCMSLAASIISSIVCLWSRLDNESAKKFLSHHGAFNHDERIYSPEVMWFFHHISNLNQKEFMSRINTINSNFETKALSSQIYILSSSILYKHRWVNRGFLFSGLCLISFLLVGISYVLGFALFNNLNSA
jgi:hypothetical protein